MLVDRFGRVIENLRLSVTSRCNLNCIFCHAEGYTPTACNKTDAEEMSLSEILKVVKVCATQGIRSVKITGGEPLLRWDIQRLVEGISQIEGIEEVSMVSNGTLLEPLAGRLKKAGLKRINVSVHTTRRDTYEKLTGKDLWKEAVKGLKKAKKVGLETKMNVAVIKGYNDDELFDIVEFAEELGVNLQLIEYHSPHFIRPEFKLFYYSLGTFEKELERRAVRVYERKMNRRKRFEMSSGIYVETVRPMFNSDFCANCRRIRVMGYAFKPCLMKSIVVPFEKAFRSENPEKEIEKALKKAVMMREPYFR